MKHFLPAIRFKIFMTILLGLAYPFFMTKISQLAFPKQAGGNFVQRGGEDVGSTLIGQKFEKPQYFWSRPSAVDYNPLASGGSNLGPISADLKKAVAERHARLQSSHAINGLQDNEPPQDLLFASASGLDPHISLAAARYQMARVASARKMDLAQVQQGIDKATLGRQWGFLGEPTVNVLLLNLFLDQTQGIDTPPTPTASVTK